MEENKEFNTEFCKQSIDKDYENLIAELFKLPKELNSIHYILPLLMDDYKSLQEDIIYKYEKANNPFTYESELSITYKKRKDAFLNKKFLFMELESLGYQYNEFLDSCFYKLYTKLTIVSTDYFEISEAGIFFPLIDNFEEIPKTAFRTMSRWHAGDQILRSKEIAEHKEKSVQILFKDFLKSDLYNRKK